MQFKKYLLVFALLVSPFSANAIPITITSGEVPSDTYESSGPNGDEVYNIELYEPDNVHGWRSDSDGNVYHYQERGTATI